MVFFAAYIVIGTLLSLAYIALDGEPKLSIAFLILATWPVSFPIYCYV